MYSFNISCSFLDNIKLFSNTGIQGRELKKQHLVKKFGQNSRSLRNVANHCLESLIQKPSGQLRQTNDNIETASRRCKCQELFYQIHSLKRLLYLAFLLKVGLCLEQRNPDQEKMILM